MAASAPENLSQQEHISMKTLLKTKGLPQSSSKTAKPPNLIIFGPMSLVPPLSLSPPKVLTLTANFSSLFQVLHSTTPTVVLSLCTPFHRVRPPLVMAGD